jgi:hypothetical protein
MKQKTDGAKNSSYSPIRLFYFLFWYDGDFGPFSDDVTQTDWKRCSLQWP